MKSKGIFIKENIAKLSVEPTLVSLSDCPNFVEFSKIDELIEETTDDRIFYLQIIGNGFDDNENAILQDAIFTIEENITNDIRIFIGTHDKYENEPIEENPIYLFDVTDNRKDLIAKRVTECLKKVDFLASAYNIEQVKNVNGTEDESGTIIRFKLKPNARTLGFSFEMKPENTFIAHSENPFEQEIDPQNKIVLEIGARIYSDNEEIIKKQSTITLTDGDNNQYTFHGTKDRSKVSYEVFYIEEKETNREVIIAENIKNCLQKNSFINSNFQVELNYMKDIIQPIINLTPLNKNNPTFLKTNTIAPYFNTKKGKDEIEITNSDSISPNAKDTSIEIEVYNTNNDSFLGENNYRENSMGTYMTTLRKAYHGQPLWFDLNTLISNKNTFSNNFLEGKTWYDAGTAVNYRFVARRWDGVNRDPIYLSDVLHSITGYGRNLDENDLEKYIYNAQVQNTGMSPLTHKTKLTHIEGQSQYFNFILQDADRTKREEKDFSLIYRLYTQSGKLIEDGVPDGKYKRQAIAKSDLNIVNTIKLEIDEQINEYKKMLGDMAKEIGYVKVSLCHTVWDEEIEDEKTVRIKRNIESQSLEFKILPKCLHKINDFAFLNALGGWSSFNFGGEERTDFRASGNNIFKTQTPHYKSSNEIESVQNQDIKEVFSAKTSPIDSATVEWLKEMSASVAVYELSTNRYIIVDEMNIQPNTKNELFTVEMKYRYSDSFNGRIK